MTLLTPLTIEEIRAKFPNPNIELHHGEPTFTAIYSAEKKLRENATTIHTSLGGGSNGHLGVLTTPADYTIIAGEAFNDPADPGATPVLVGGTTAVDASNLKDVYNSSVYIHGTWRNVVQVLKNQILSAFEEVHLLALKNDTSGFTHVTPRTMLTHLYDVYGQIHRGETIKNRNRLQLPFDPTQPVILLFNRYLDISNFAALAGSPITDEDKLTNAYVIIQDTGVYDRALETWDEKTAAFKTWNNFKIHITKEYVKIKSKQQSHASNTVNAATTQRLEDNENHVLNLTTTIQATTLALATQLKECQDTLTTVTKDIQELKARNNAGNNNGNNRGNRRGNGNAIRQRRKYYCWTHGLTNNARHISGNCEFPKQGHIDGATFDNKQGGSTANVT